MTKKLVGLVIMLACPAIVVSSENGIAASVPQVKVQIPTVHIVRVTPPTVSKISTPASVHDQKQFLLNMKLNSQGTMKGKSTKVTSTPTDGVKTGPYSLTNRTQPSLIDNVGFPSLDASSKNTAVFNVYPSFSFNKIDPTGKASVVSLINPSVDSHWAPGDMSPKETVTLVYGGLTVSNSKVSDRVSPAVILGLAHGNKIIQGQGDPDRPFIIGSAYNKASLTLLQGRAPQGSPLFQAATSNEPFTSATLSLRTSNSNEKINSHRGEH
jgi:hypothetical protein